jgi:hypothetical protein
VKEKKKKRGNRGLQAMYGVAVVTRCPADIIDLKFDPKKRDMW